MGEGEEKEWGGEAKKAVTRWKRVVALGGARRWGLVRLAGESVPFGK